MPALSIKELFKIWEITAVEKSKSVVVSHPGGINGGHRCYIVSLACEKCPAREYFGLINDRNEPIVHRCYPKKTGARVCLEAME